MKRSLLLTSSAVILILLASGPVFGHGLMEEPASRNWFCGAITKPDHVLNGTAAYPVCGDAFAADFTGGYNFMSVLTHDVGRSGVTPLPEHVCGFGSETWNGGATPWDTPIDWPTNNMTPGRNEIVWNISWGPHFDDTEEFRYWITKSSFQFQVGVPLTWDDFDTQPFCVLTYDDANPGGNPDVVSDKPATRFHTFCDVPARSGRHVIYGEWGRNFFTFERFHGCIDAVFDGSPGTVDARIAAQPDVTEIVGSGSLQLDGSGSTGSNLSYQWAVSAADPSLYNLSAPTSAATQLSYGNPTAAGSLTVSLTVSDGQSSDSASLQLSHLPDTPATFELLGPLTAEARTLSEGDRVSVRAVLDNGQDVFYPSSPLVITSSNTAADAWPVDLANAVNAPGSALAIGVIDGNGAVVPVADATANQIYARLPTDVASAFLIVGSGPASCEFIVTNEWDSGFTANIRITNGGSTPIDGWQVSWEFTDGSQVDHLWSANLSGSNPYSASNLEWNRSIAPGAFAEFGFVGIKGGSGVEIPRVNGAVCN
ncbi:MAG: cellulose binding domain-containing protein [Holophagales bacterium]|nr:cellulose binding domain-containing protein [Holophagales bacterium]